MTTEHLYQLFLQHPSVTTDTRKLQPGALFFALKGANFDGNQFAEKALQQGAAYAIVDDAALAGKSDRLVLVNDVLKALQDLARHHRRQFDIPVICITGSNGKTTTKELMHQVMSTAYPTHCTQGNFNNHIGVPLTLLALRYAHEVAIIEMGANHQGEIDALSRIAEPTHGLITNIGKAHLEGFGGIEGVKKGKSELYRFLAETNGIAMINSNEPFLPDLAAPVKKKVFYCQSGELDPNSAPFEIRLVGEQPTVRVGFLNNRGQYMEATSQLTGFYNFRNIMTAIAVGRYFKVPGEKIKLAIESYRAENNRSQLVKWRGNDVILDAYNANPTSVAVALASLKGQQHPAKVAILGDMLELGEDTVVEHRRIVEEALGAGLEALVLVGAHYQAIAAEHGLAHFPDVYAAREWLQQQTWKEKLVLIKGSRKMQLERLLEAQ